MSIGACGVLLSACEAPPPAVITPIPVTPRAAGTPTVERSVAVAVVAASPTATPALVGDYATLVRPRAERIQQGLGRLEKQLGVLQKSPMRMAQEDWRIETRGMLDELAMASTDLRALGARVGPDAPLYADVLKLLGDVDFVVDEYRMAFDFDPDATHFARAGRAERSAADEVESILSGLRHPIGRAPTPTPYR